MMIMVIHMNGRMRTVHVVNIVQKGKNGMENNVLTPRYMDVHDKMQLIIILLKLFITIMKLW